MNKLKVVEKFISINGEGRKAGQLAVFIRFAYCNLSCVYCDTKWANQADVSYNEMDADAIYDYIKKTGVKNITLTGGEPLLQPNMERLLRVLAEDENLYIEIETNGSVGLERFKGIGFKNPPSYTMDYKLPGSHMEQHMNQENLNILDKDDTVKFVVSSIGDLDRAYEIIMEHSLTTSTNVYLSPVFGDITGDDIVEYMKSKNMNDITLQIQMHKVIWDPERKGV